MLQLVHLSSNLTTQMVDGRLRVKDIKTARICHTIEVGKRELVMMPRTISPYRPDKKREHRLAILSEIIIKVEDAVVVERNSYADIMK